MKSFLAAIFILLLSFPGNAFARTYRCNGMVRHRPCEQEVTGDNFRVLHNPSSQAMRTHSGSSRGALKPGFFSKVSGASFEPIDKTLGRWRGFISGNGLVHLHMQIYRNKVLESTRYMGKILLSPSDRSIPFRFESALPKGTDWSWNILGSETPPL